MVKETLTLLVTSLTLITSLISCEEIQVSQSVSSEDEIEIVFIVEPRLDQDGNGYYHLELNPSTFQTLHRLSGHIYRNGIPLDVMKFNWESSHFWMLGDTLGYFIHRGLTDDLEYVSYDTTYITGFSDFIVPTINCCSYSNSEGLVSSVIGVVKQMISDTLTISVTYYHPYTEIHTQIQCILQYLYENV